jgi:hypothetical protein
MQEFAYMVKRLSMIIASLNLNALQNVAMKVKIYAYLHITVMLLVQPIQIVRIPNVVLWENANQVIHARKESNLLMILVTMTMNVSLVIVMDKSAKLKKFQ